MLICLAVFCLCRYLRIAAARGRRWVRGGQCWRYAVTRGTPPGLGLWVTADPRPLVASARKAVQSFATGECAASAAQAIIGLACRTAAATRLELSIFFALGRRLDPLALRRGLEEVERRPLDGFTEDGSGAVPTTGRVSPRQPQTLPAQNAAPAHLYNRINRKLKASINLNRHAEAQETPRVDHRALRQRL